MNTPYDIFKRRSNLVIWAIIVFNIFTIVLYATAPLNYNRTETFYLTLAYLILSLFFIYRGFQFGVKIKKNDKDLQNLFLGKISHRIISFVFIFYALTFLIRYAYLLRFYPWEVGKMFQFLVAGFIDPYWAYHIALDDTRPFTISWTMFFLTSIVNQIFFIFCFVSWKGQNKLEKMLTILFVAIELFYWKGRATNFGVISLIIIFVISQMVGTLQDSGRKKRSSNKRILFLATVMFSFAVFSFSNTMSGRTNEADASTNFIDTKGYVFSILPENMWSSYYYVVSYMAQGYNNLSLAMSLEQTPWTYGMGNNPTLMSMANLVIGAKVMDQSYMKALDDQFHVDEFAAWHSAYLWWANDFTYFGVPFVLFFMAFCVGLAFKLSLLHNDFLSKIVFVALTAMLLTLFANNNFLSNIFYSFMFIFPIWLFTRMRMAN